MKSKGTQLFGIMSIILGSCGLIPLIIDDTSRFVLSSDFFIVKYAIVILFLSGSIWFITLGVLMLSPNFKPYNSEYITQPEKHRLKFYTGLLAAPFFITIFFLGIFESKRAFWKAGVSFMLLYYVYDIGMASYNYMKSKK